MRAHGKNTPYARGPLTAFTPLLVLLAACAAGCGNTTASSSAGSCGVRPAGYFATARVVFVGTMLAGRTVNVGGHTVLVSPARVRVARYFKGTGPRVVTVVTGITRSTRGNAVSEVGIQPEPGQRWKIYTSSTRQPFHTSICDGTRPVSDVSK